MSSSFFLPGDGAFPDTHWSLIHRVKGGGEEAEKAIAHLCSHYWFPVFVYLRKRSKDRFEAEDLTQGFFHHLLKDNLVVSVNQNQGRFRAFLMRCCQNFCVDEFRHRTAQKRGGGQKFVSIDSQEAETRYQRISKHQMNGDREFNRSWAVTLLEQTFDRLRDEYAGANRLEIYEALRPNLTNEPSANTYRQIGERLRMSEDTIKKAAETLRKRFAKEIRRFVAQTLSHPTEAEIENEIRELFLAFQS